ncbi:MAG: anthranilate synthase component I [Robiginitomaculum sp.]|nr:anthranilate synthase component I [Robiginitomaculum sp.]MDQ7077187.1 anthranilate synthase component I [Robiginitomaculum sp.]
MTSALRAPDDAFCTRYAQGDAQILTRTVIDDLITPVAAMLRLGPQSPNIFLMESVQGGDWRGRYSIIGLNPDARWRVRNGQAEKAGIDGKWTPVSAAPIEALRQFIRASQIELPTGLPPMAAGVFGYLGYDMVRHVEALPAPNPDTLGLDDALLLRPTLVAIFDSVAQEIVLSTPVRPHPDQNAKEAYESAMQRLDTLQNRLGTPAQSSPIAQGNEHPPMAEPTSNTTPEHYRDMVERAREYIKAGDIFQMVPSQRFSAPLAEHPFALYRSLRRLNPSPFLYYLNFEDFSVVGSSPEILVRVRNRKVTIRPIAGTRPRGANPAEDAALEADLLADPKERAEHLMLLDLGRNDAGRACKAGTIQVTEQFGVEHYSHVMHIVSNVEGDLDDNKDAVDALFAGFPAGTVSGAPKIRAMEIINELEVEKRGLYAGAIGYFSAGGDMDTCIALRTAVIKNGTMYVQAGGGVVLDSDPEAERMETVHKSRALFRAAAQAWRFEERA